MCAWWGLKGRSQTSGGAFAAATIFSVLVDQLLNSVLSFFFFQVRDVGALRNLLCMCSSHFFFLFFTFAFAFLLRLLYESEWLSFFFLEGGWFHISPHKNSAFLLVLLDNVCTHWSFLCAFCFLLFLRKTGIVFRTALAFPFCGLPVFSFLFPCLLVNTNLHTDWWHKRLYAVLACGACAATCASLAKI